MAREERALMATARSASVSRSIVFGLVAAVAVGDIVGNVLAPDTVRIPVKLAIVVALVIWSRRYVGLTWDELGLERANVGAGLRLGGVAAGVVAAVLAVLVAIT